MSAHRIGLAVTLVVVLANAIAVAAGFVPLRTGVIVTLAVEVPLAVATSVAGVWAFRTRRRAGATRADALGAAIGPLPARFVQFEWTWWRSLALWARRRRDGVGRPGVIGFGYSRGTLGIPFAFLVACVVELVVLHVLVPWPAVRGVLFVLGVYSIVMVVGIVATAVVHPHLLDDDVLVVRSGARVVATVPRDAIRTVRARRRFDTDRGIVDGVLCLPGPDGTAVELALSTPVTATLPTFLPRADGSREVTEIRLHVDDAAALRDALLGRAASVTGPG